jgi:hypothetical protein
MARQGERFSDLSNIVGVQFNVFNFSSTEYEVEKDNIYGLIVTVAI